jgi:hypothetical protein
MRPQKAWSGSSRTLTLLLLAVVVPPAAMFVRLGGQMLHQDEVLEDPPERFAPEEGRLPGRERDSEESREIVSIPQAPP